jgi:hypothetical protein
MRASRLRVAGWITAAGLAALVALYSLAFLMIEVGVDRTAKAAMARFPGDRVVALAAQAGCESCSLSDRNHAIWALGQLRDARALPVLKQYYTGAPCDHDRGLCQREIRSALRAIEGSRLVVWLGYRDLRSAL